MNNETVPYFVRMTVAWGKNVSTDFDPRMRYASFVPRANPRIKPRCEIPLGGVYVKVTPEREDWRVGETFYDSRGSVFEQKNLTSALKEKAEEALKGVGTKELSRATFNLILSVPGRLVTPHFKKGDRTMQTRARIPFGEWLTRPTRVKD